jgi:dienelactone hydrolase
MKRLTFPLINGLVAAMLMGLVGYYLNNFAAWLVAGTVLGFGVGLLTEFGFKRLNARLYRLRVLLVLIEIPLIIFGAAPYAYVAAMLQPNPSDVCCSSPADFGVLYESVTIPVADGVSLAGWFIAPTAEHGATVLLLHGGGGNRMGTMWHAEQLIRAGYGVLMYDQRAVGESGGDQQTSGWLDAADMPYILDFVSAQEGVNPQRIGGVGLSLGAHILLIAAPDNLRLAALWLDGLQAGGIEDLPPNESARDGFEYVMSQMMLTMMDWQIPATPPPSVHALLPEVAPRPMMIVVTGLDEYEYRINEGYTSLLGDNAEQWVIEDAGHTGGPSVVPDEYAARMIAFFEAALVGN